jgi:hypothetical protein
VLVGVKYVSEMREPEALFATHGVGGIDVFAQLSIIDGGGGALGARGPVEGLEVQLPEELERYELLLAGPYRPLDSPLGASLCGYRHGAAECDRTATG